MAILTSKNRYWNKKNVARNKERYFMIRKGTADHEDTTMVSIYACNNGAKNMWSIN